MQIIKALCVLFLSFLMVFCSKRDRKHENTGTKPVFQVSKSTVIEPKLYLEHSGSMFGYDGSMVKGQFKNTLVTLMQGFEKIKPGVPKVYIVNDKVYSYPKSFEDLITTKSIFQTKIGNPAFTDFKAIFSTILTDLKQDQVSILFSDLIYSGKDSQGKSAEKIMNEAEQLCQLTFTNNDANISTSIATNTSILVLKLNADFQGLYYSYNSPNKGKKYSGNRPYYVCLFAKNQTMEKFLKDELYSEITSFEKLPDFRNKIFFTNSSLLSNPYYTILQKDSDGRGKFNKNKGERDLNKNGLHAIEDVAPPHRSNDKLTICVAVSFPKTALEEAEVTDINNYQIDAFKDGFKLKSVKPVNLTDGTTYKLILEANKVAGGQRDVKIKFKRKFPPKWVTDTHSTDDTNINPNANFVNQTFGINSIMKGLNNAFTQPSADKNYYFTLTLKLDD